MAYANELVANQASLTSGQLLVDYERKLQASEAITNGGPGGLVESLDRRRGGEMADGVGPYTAGTDRMRDLAINATFTSGQPMAFKNRGSDEPRKLHLVVEADNRYKGSTGRTSLTGLARMTTALACISAEKFQASIATTVVSEGYEPYVMDYFDDGNYEAVVPLRNYDNYVAQPTKATKNASEGLAEGLDDIVKDGFYEDSDVCLVVSDFMTGAEYNAEGKLDGFKWAKPLRALHEILNDRLYVIRLITPAQTELPYARSYAANGRSMKLDRAGYLNVIKACREQGLEKADRITRCLQRIRHIDLSSTEKYPFIAVSDFMFGKPPEV